MRSYAKRSLKTMVTFLLVLHVAAITYAADATWNGSVSSDWSNSANWDAGVLPNSGGNVYLNALGNAPTNQDIVGLVIQDLEFAVDFTNGITIAGEAFSMDDMMTTADSTSVVHHKIMCNLTLTSDMDNTIMVNVTMELAGSIGDSGNGYRVFQLGLGTIILSGSNTYSGITKINSGKLYFYKDENLGAVPVSLVSESIFGRFKPIILTAPAGVNFHKATIHSNRGIRSNFNVESGSEMNYAGSFVPYTTPGTLTLRGGTAATSESIMHIGGDSSASLTSLSTVSMNAGLIVLESDNAFGTAKIITSLSTIDLNGHSPTCALTEHNTSGLVDGTGNGTAAEAHYINNDMNHVSVLSGDYAPTYYNTASRAFGGRGDIEMLGSFSDGGGNAVVLHKLGNGTVTLGGSNAYTGNTRLDGGELILDHTTDNNAKLSSANIEQYGTGITLLGNDSTPSIETVGDLDLDNPNHQYGGNFISVIAGDADATFSFDNLELAATGVGNPIDFRTSTTGSGTAKIIGCTVVNTAAGILSGGATFNGKTWATVDVNSNIVGLADIEFSSTLAANVHWDVQNGTATVSANTAVDSLRFDDPAGAMNVSIDSGKRLSLTQYNPSQMTGMLMTSQAGGDAEIGGAGYIMAGGYWYAITIHQYNTDHTLTISAQIQDNLTYGGLCKTGPGEAIVNNDTSDFGNSVGVFGGTLTFTSINDKGFPSSLGAGGPVVIGVATLKYTGTGHTTDRPIWVRGLATIEAAGSGTLQLTNSVSIRTPDVKISSGSQTLILTGVGNGQVDGNVELGAFGSLYKRGTGTWTLNATNTYRYPTVIEEGTLAVNGSMRGDVEVQSGGTLKSSGATFKRDMVLGGTLAYDISATSTNLEVWGEVTLGGDLEITKTGGSEGIIITSDYPITGTFSSVTYGYEVTYNENSVVLGIAPPQGTLLIVR